MTTIRNLVVAIAVLIGTTAAIPAPAQQSPDRVQVLFLGGEGVYHEPADRAKQILPEMARRGINMEYMDDPAEALDADVLKDYDALILYADHFTITPSQERALLNYVQDGGGFVPVHCASGSFRNSEAYIRLVGGAFDSHGDGTFTTRRLQPDHPAIEDVPQFSSWDETYVHKKHNPDKTVLSVREEDGHTEPWTWVRRHGDGRVFYTAWGHDERTWSEPGFQDLLERGTRWAAGDEFIAQTRPDESFEYVTAQLPSLQYESSPENEREPRQMQLPLSPDASMQHMATPPGFRVELFASEPDIVNPIDMIWDEQGRLWIAETFDYPNDLKEAPEEGRDRIRILEDTDGDGRADEFTVFADELSIPTSLAFANGGLVVTAPPHTLFLKDTDGDDRADVREVLFTGWGTFDTHASANNIHYGLDNQIWGTLGYSGFEGTVGGEEHKFTQGIYRFQPDGSDMEYLRTTSNNTWGLGMSEEGHTFASTANGNPSVYMAIPNRYYQKVDGFEANILEMIAENARVHPITTRTRQGDHKGNYTAGSGHDLYTARSFPQKYWNRAAFVGGPTVRLLGKYFLEPQGSDFVARNGWNMLASRDEWTAPVAAKTGPDGAVWMIDWYNYVPQHNLGPFWHDSWERGEHNAYVTDLRDREHGRIYRIVYEDGSAQTPMNLAGAGARELVQALRHDNMFWRLTAQRLLVERGQTDILPDLYDLVRDERTDALGLNPGATHALWTMHGLGALDGGNALALEVALDALYHPSSGVRQNALRVLPPSVETRDEILSGEILDDTEPQVRKEALLALSEVPSSSRAGRAAAETILIAANAADRWIPDAAIAAGAQHAAPFLRRMMQAELPEDADDRYGESIRRVVRTVSRHYAGGEAGEIVSLVRAVERAEPSYGEALLAGLAAGWPEDRTQQLSAREQERLRGVAEGLSPQQREQLQALTERWGTPDLLSQAR